MKYNLKGKGIFAFSDPAGSNSTLALVKLLNESNSESFAFELFTSQCGYIPQNTNLPIKRLGFKFSQANDIIKLVKPDFIFTATSTNDYEHNWRKIAQQNNIKTIGFIDHWTNYYERFCFNDELILPDEIWVVNDTAKFEAIEAGLPEEKIVVSGNPYYDIIKKYKPDVSKQDIFDQLGLNTNKKTILFISDDIKRSFPSDVDGNCILGFDEYTVLEDILKSLKLLTGEIEFCKYQLVIKLHPKADFDKFNNILNDHILEELDIMVLKNCDPLAINYYSDFVLGMFSNMVIESLLIGKKVLRVQVGQKIDDLLKLSINAPIIKYNDQLLVTIKGFLNLK